MPGTRSRRAEYKITKMTLGELRWLVDQCEGLPDDSTVDVQKYKSLSPVDWDEAYIKVSGDLPE